MANNREYFIGRAKINRQELEEAKRRKVLQYMNRWDERRSLEVKAAEVLTKHYQKKSLCRSYLILMVVRSFVESKGRMMINKALKFHEAKVKLQKQQLKEKSEQEEQSAAGE